MESSSIRFTAAEGGARLAANAGSQNVLVTEHTAFVATSVLLEHAYMIRGPLTSDRKRSFYITRASRTRCTAHELSILTDLKVSRVNDIQEVEDWAMEVENKEVFVCTSTVFKYVLEEKILSMQQINVLIIDSCHLIFKDQDLQYIMSCYKESDECKRPRILALTYPLFTLPKDNDNNENNENNDNNDNDDHHNDITNGDDNDDIEREIKGDKELIENNDDKTDSDNDNIDDFDLYEKLEWKIEELEKILCCKMDLAEDIDSGKRMSSSLAKPKEVIIEYRPRASSTELPEDYIQLEEYMRDAVNSALEFINEHRYDPTEIYGEDMYEEFKNIPDPTLEPKAIFKQFLYVLDQLGPYAADKAAFSLLIKLEKLKIKVPYERHFLLLCVCTSVFVKIRCFTDSILSKYDNDWEKITTFLTPKMLRLAEILEQFYQNESADKLENEKDLKNCIDEKVEDNVNKNGSSEPSSETKTDISKTNQLLNEIDKCDFVTLGNKIEDRVHIYEANLKDYDENYTGEKNTKCSEVENKNGESENKIDDSVKNDNVIDIMSESPKFKRQGHRSRGRGRVSRVNKVQMQANPDALCGIVFVKEPLMAKILFMLIVDLSRSRPTLSHLCAQYCTDEGDAKEHRRHEEVLKKFRMHECNLLLATSVLEEGIDLPRCNLVVRWDMPPSYRSHALCRGRARACRAAVTLLSKAETHTDRLLHHLAIYRELDQIITRKCGCGIQYEPPQEEENHADTVAFIVKSYTPLENKIKKCESIEICDKVGPCLGNSINDIEEKLVLDENCITENEDCTKEKNSVIYQDIVNKEISEIINGDKNNHIMKSIENFQNKIEANASIDEISQTIANIEVKDDSDVNKTLDFRENDKKLENIKYEYKVKNGNDETLASVDLNTAIALINRYCGKLPSDTFTRLTAQWRTERVVLKDRRGEPRDAYVCTLRMPLNCPVKFNIVGHPMPTRSLARRMAALLASRVLHRVGELDDQLLPIGKENFKAAEMENINLEESGENARPGTTKRRQYYYKRTAAALTNCRPIVEYTDEDVEKNPHTSESGKVVSRNTLYAIESRLCCALPERYNTRGRRLHAPQNASQAIGILMLGGTRFMEFVFSDVLRVRRRGMKLADNTPNNYYVVPTVKKTSTDGTTWIDIDWPFLDLIYQHTEEKRCLDIDKPMLWAEENKKEDKKGKKIENPLLKPGEVFVFDAEKYKEAVVTPWYRNQDQPQFFLVAEICWNLTPDSSFPSSQHASFRSYYKSKYGAELTQSNQPLLDVDHTSARLNLLTPRYVNRKGVALPVSSERTRRAKRDRLDQKQILVAELCVRHPFAAPLWCAAVALPCALYRINALLLADEVRRAVSRDVGVGQPRDDISWPPLDFGWSLAEVLNADSDKGDKKKDNEISDGCPRDTEKDIQKETEEKTEVKEKTINDILQEKEDAENGFEIGTWSNDMASSIPLDELMEPLPPNVTFCTSSSGGANWSDPIDKPKNDFNPTRTFSMADSDCSYMSSDFDTDDSNMSDSDDDMDTTGFCSSKNTNAAMGVRIEYKTAHEAEAVDIERRRPIAPAPQNDALDDARDLKEWGEVLREGNAPEEYVKKFKNAVLKHEAEIKEKGFLVDKNTPIIELLPETVKELDKNNELLKITNKNDSNLNGDNKLTIEDCNSDIQIKDKDKNITELLDDIFPYGNLLLIENGQITLESIERNKRVLLKEIKDSLNEEEIKKMQCFSMKDVDIDSPDYVNEKIVNVGFDTKDKYIDRVNNWRDKEFKPYYLDSNGINGKEFDFDYQPDLEGHPGPSPSVILQALTMSNANDGINLERLETIGDSFLKFAITAYLYCALPAVHEGKLSHMRSKQVSNLNLYRLGRNKRLGERMIASKFEPHDNWLPPCHKPPPTLQNHGDLKDGDSEPQVDSSGCFIPYNLITEHSIPDKSIADCVEALIGAYLLECGPRGALLFMSWLGITVLPTHTVELPDNHPFVVKMGNKQDDKHIDVRDEEDDAWCWEGRPPGSLKPYKDKDGRWVQTIYGALKSPPSPLLRYIEDPEGELERMLSGYDALEATLQYRFRDRSLLLTALTHASCHNNTLTDCYQRLEFLGDAILDYLITRHLYEDPRRHSPGALTDLRSALVNNTIFATLAARHGFHKYFRHMSPGLNEVLTKYVKIQEENGHSISEEHYLIQEDEMEQAEDVEVPKALGDLFESVAGAIFLDSGMSLAAVWRAVGGLLRAELDAFSAAAPKSPVRELLEAEPDTAKFGKPERLADGRRVRVCVEVFGRGSFKGVGRNYRIAKGTAARCALRHLRSVRPR
ncbi:unnamed protein product [Danaus chrysippus]|uniref:ribonuclease III n=1 Tax=Danaus chrysippus TaxID=151541 RepID=A0A8J2QYS2_9NEOP|nr:unnamed protein product [Danaus chrysippus]